MVAACQMTRAFDPGNGTRGDKKRKSHLTVAAQAGEQLFAGNHVAPVCFGDAGFKFGQIIGQQANVRLFVTADDDNLRAVDELRIIEHDPASENSPSGYAHGQTLHRANAASQTCFRARDGIFNRVPTLLLVRFGDQGKRGRVAN